MVLPQPMFPENFASSRLPRVTRPRRLLSALAGLALALSGSAQVGSVSFEFRSFDEVQPSAAVSELFEHFESLRVLPLRQASNAPVDYLILQRFQTVGTDDPDLEGGRRPHLVAEYDAYFEGSIDAEDTVRESGLLSFSFASENLPSAGSNVVGFIQHDGVSLPSTWNREAETGYLTGLSGALSWDFFASSRQGFMEGNAAAYDPDFVHQDYIGMLVQGQFLILDDYLPAVAGSEDLNWFVNFSSVRPLLDRATRMENLYYAIADRLDGLGDEELGLDTETTEDDLVPASLGDPVAFNNQLFVLLLEEDGDADGDGIPDFLDLTTTVEAMPSYADYTTPSAPQDWYYTKLLQDWVYSPRTTVWDFATKLGWIYAPPSSPRNRFWHYAYAEELGWLYTTDSWFPVFYRHRDGAYLRWLATPRPGEESRFYNYATGKIETIAF